MSSPAPPTSPLTKLIMDKRWHEVLLRTREAGIRRMAGTDDSSSCCKIHGRIHQSPFMGRSLLDVYPEHVVSKPNARTGWLPIHYACAKRAPAEVVRCLLDFYPDGASKPNKRSWLPIHYACANDPSVEAIQSLLHAYPPGGATPTSKGWLPLHILCRRGARLDVVQAVLDAHPEAAGEMDHNGDLPLHIALRIGKAQGDVVRALIRSCPNAARRRARGGTGCLPIHQEFNREVPRASVIFALMDAYPDGHAFPGSCGNSWNKLFMLRVAF